MTFAHLDRMYVKNYPSKLQDQHSLLAREVLLEGEDCVGVRGEQNMGVCITKLDLSY